MDEKGEIIRTKPPRHQAAGAATGDEGRQGVHTNKVNGALEHVNTLFDHSF